MAGEPLAAEPADQNPAPLEPSDGNGDEAAPQARPSTSFSLAAWFNSVRASLSKAAPSIPISPDQEPISEPASGSAGASASQFNPVVSESKVSAQPSDAIFQDIGQQLRTRREMLSLTYEEIERHTHVRSAFLAALELGRLEDLPSLVQTRGILLNYATFLDLDVDAILLRFADGVQARYREKGPRNPVRSKAPLVIKRSLPPLRGFIAGDLIFGGGLAIALLLFAVWGINRVMVMHAQELPAATPVSISQALFSTPLPTLAQQVTVIPAENTAAVTTVAPDGNATATLELATLDPTAKVQVILTATQSTYMRITVDGKVKFEGRAEAGNSYSYDATSQVEVLTGNAAALRVTYNTRDLGLMGNFGEVVDRLYTAEGVATPTATAQPTHTPTPRVTATPTQSATPTPSPTPTR